MFERLSATFNETETCKGQGYVWIANIVHVCFVWRWKKPKNLFKCPLVNETLWPETETRPWRLTFSLSRDRDRDFPTFCRDQDETDKFERYNTYARRSLTSLFPRLNSWNLQFQLRLHPFPGFLYFTIHHILVHLSAICLLSHTLKFITSSPAKSSSADYIPSSLIKACPDVFSNLMHNLPTFPSK